MDDVYHHIDAKISANSSLFGFFGVGWADDRPNAINRVLPGKREDDDGGGLHKCFELREEAFVEQMGIVFLQEFW